MRLRLKDDHGEYKVLRPQLVRRAAARLLVAHRAFKAVRAAEGLAPLLNYDDELACVDACSAPTLGINLCKKLTRLWRRLGRGLVDAPNMRSDAEKDAELASNLERG